MLLFINSLYYINVKKKYFIIAGESSGDEHGSLLMKEMSHLDQHISFEGIGGKKMTAQGLSSLYQLIKRGKNKEALHFMEEGLKEKYENLENIINIEPDGEGPKIGHLR